MLQALIFDVDGTLADTEGAHRAAFNHAFRAEGLDWVWDETVYTELLAISGGTERMLHYWKTACDLKEVGCAGVHDTIARLHELKTAEYEAMVRDGQVHLRPGVLHLIESASQQGLQLAIATTTSPVNVTALLRTSIGLNWRHYFAVIEDASTAPHKKPHPQVYLQTLTRMGLSAADTLAIEDSANGLNAATRAGLATLITPNRFTAHHDFSAALRVVLDLLGIKVSHLRAWHGECLARDAARD